MTVPKKGITASRKTPEKIQYLIDHYGECTRKKLAEAIGESPRWVKRQLSLLSKNKEITQAKVEYEYVVDSLKTTFKLPDDESIIDLQKLKRKISHNLKNIVFEKWRKYYDLVTERDELLRDLYKNQFLHYYDPYPLNINQ